MSKFGTINLTDSAVLTEEELLDRAREGDKSAFGTLYLRHRDAARRVAGMCASSPADADDAVAEGFARVFAALPRMGGREITFRPYLLTCVRNAATDRLRRERRVDLREQMPETAGQFQADDVALLGLERNLVGEALQALPARWRTVLWLTEVEGLSPAEVSTRIGIKPNAVAALAYRARKGLREAYLQAHLRAEASTECRATVSRLGNYVRADLNAKDRLAVQTHLDTCAKCRCRRDELTDVNATLRNALIPVPLLLVGAKSKWFSFSSAPDLWTKSAELVQVVGVTATESPLAHKAVAGITMVALALSGAAVPKLVDKSPKASQTQVALGAPLEVATTDQAKPGPLELSMRGLSPQTPASAATTSAAGGTAPATPGSTGAIGGTVDAGGIDGGTRSSLLSGSGKGRTDDPDRAGGTRSTLLDPETGAGNGSLLAGTPVADVLGMVSTLVPVQALIPVEVGVSVPGIGDVVGTAPTAGDLHLSIGPAGPLAGVVAPLSLSVPAPEVLAGPVETVETLVADLISPLAGLLRTPGS